MRNWFVKILSKHFPSLYYRKVPPNHPTLRPPAGFDPTKAVVLDQKAQAELGELLKNAPIQGNTRHD